MTTRTRNLRFPSGSVQLAGTLESPAGQKASRSLLLLAGSGPQDRDETIAGKKPFRELSRALAERGYQVFRWDDRGVGDSGGDYLSASADILVDDVVNAMATLSRATGFETHTLLGHSQGTLIAAQVAAGNPAHIDGLALLAGMGLPGRLCLANQFTRICREEGIADENIDIALAQRETLFDVLLQAQADIDNGTAEAVALSAATGRLRSLLRDDSPRSDNGTDEDDGIDDIIVDLLEWEWRFLLRVDPADALRRVRCPVLAMTGDKDTQVDCDSDLAAIEVACQNGTIPHLQKCVLPGHNHLFQAALSGAPGDYAELGPPFAEAAVMVIDGWLAGTLPPARRRLP